MSKNNDELTVKELIAVLLKMPQDADVLTNDGVGCAWISGAYVDKDGDVIIANKDVA